jgi:ribosomal protein S19E (S16A)
MLIVKYNFIKCPIWQEKLENIYGGKKSEDVKPKTDRQ